MIHETIKDLAVPIDQVHPYARNPRRGNVEAIADSLRRNGQYRPIVARLATGEVLAGNHTLAAAQALGWQEVAVTWVDVDDHDAARIVAVDNRANDQAAYDDAALVELLTSLPDLGGTGYTPEDLDKLISAAADDLLEQLPEPGDADTDDDLVSTWGVIITCTDEAEQVALLQRFADEGLPVRALTTTQ
jgi:ParB-like chromosome segregation protein Spo0J